MVGFQRRDFLAGVSGISIGLVSGCLGLGGDGDDAGTADGGGTDLDTPTNDDRSLVIRRDGQHTVSRGDKESYRSITIETGGELALESNATLAVLTDG